MNQGKLEEVKQERVILSIEESMSWNGLEWVNLAQMTIISTTVHKNP